MIENTAAMCLIIEPFALIASTIGPSLLAKTVAEASMPLTTVDGAVFKGVLTLFLVLTVVFGPLY